MARTDARPVVATAGDGTRIYFVRVPETRIVFALDDEFLDLYRSPVPVAVPEYDHT